jgi:hypothetical protein
MLDNGERVLVMLRNGTVSTIGTGYRADMPEHGELAIYPTDWTRQDGDTLVAEGSSWVELELSWVAWNEKEVALAAQPTKAVNYTSTDAFGVDRLVTTQLPADAEANWREFFQINDKRMDSPEMKANEGEYRRLSQKYGRDRMDNEFAFAVHALEAQEAEAEAAARRATENPDPAAAPNADPNANNLPTTPAPLEIPADAEAYCREFNRVASTDDPEGEMDSIRTMYEPLAAKYGHEKMNEFHRRLEARDYPAAPSVSEDAPSYAAQSAPENQEPATPAHAPALVAFFRKVLDEGPITILDDYLEVGDPDAFRFAEVYERDRVTGKPESAFAPETAEALQDEHDALLEDFSAKLLLDAALAVNEGKAGRPDGDTYTTPPVSLDNGATVDVILYEEGKRRVVHVVHSVFGLFAQLRIALGGTLDGYHPEEEVPTQYAAEHARLLAMVGINAMVEGAIAFEVWASRHEVGKEKGVLAQIHDNRPDPTPEVEPNPDDDPDEPWRDELGNAVPDFEEDDRDVYTALRVLEARSYELSQRDCDDDEKTEAGNVDEAIAALSSLRTRMQAWDKSRRDPVPSNFEHLLGRITTALAAIGFGDPDATYDADDVLTIIDQHWYDMLELTGIDQPASETAADVSAYAKPDEAFVGSHSSDSLDEARATALADAQQRALLDTLELLLTIDKRFDLECADIASSADPSRTFPCMATHDDIKAMIDRITKTLTTPAAAAATAAKGGN